MEKKEERLYFLNFQESQKHSNTTAIQYSVLRKAQFVIFELQTTVYKSRNSSKMKVTLFNLAF